MNFRPDSAPALVSCFTNLSVSGGVARVRLSPYPVTQLTHTLGGGRRLTPPSSRPIREPRRGAYGLRTPLLWRAATFVRAREGRVAAVCCVPKSSGKLSSFFG